MNVLIALAFSCALRAQELPVQISDMGLPGIVLLGQPRDSVELALGQSDTYRCERGYTSVKENKRHTSKTVIKSWDGVQKYRSFYQSKQLYVNYSVHRGEQHVRSIEIIGPGYLTRKGVSVGSTQEQVVAAYGPLHNGFAEYPQDGLSFILEDQHVVAIIVSDIPR